jgi:integrase
LALIPFLHVFSLRRLVSEAWKGNDLKIKPSWTKGGIGRTIEITNQAQHQWLQRASKLVPEGLSLIPKERTYKQHLSHYQVQTKRMGINNCHGLRHSYAQQRYHELTKQFDPKHKGLLYPIEGGTPTKKLTAIEKKIDIKARQIISRLLGHSRIGTVKIYIG